MRRWLATAFGVTLALFAATSPRLKGLDAALAALAEAEGLHLVVVGAARKPQVPGVKGPQPPPSRASLGYR